MTEYSIPYGETTREIKFPEDWQISVLKPKTQKGLDNPVQSISESLEHLGPELNARNAFSTAVVAINDKTRPVPHKLLLPPLLKWLESRGFKRENITLIIATGTHAPMPPSEHHLIVSDEIIRDYHIISHDADDNEKLVNLGITSSGTPCAVNTVFADAELKVVVGNIEPHQYMGWSGGVKSAVIGLGGAESIRTNHSMLSLKGAGPCRFENNPVRMDVEEAGHLIGVHLALNVVMNDKKEILEVFAGKPVDVMKKGIQAAQALFTVPIDSESNLVITAPGGYPKDINLYQAQKALRHATFAAEPGAPIILLAACREGIGSEPYETWMRDKTSHHQVQETFKEEDFRLGPHKAMLFAADAINRDVYLVSDLPAETVKRMLLFPAASVQDAIAMINKKWRNRKNISVAILPYGNATVPVFETHSA